MCHGVCRALPAEVAPLVDPFAREPGNPGPAEVIGLGSVQGLVETWIPRVSISF